MKYSFNISYFAGVVGDIHEFMAKEIEEETAVRIAPEELDAVRYARNYLAELQVLKT